MYKVEVIFLFECFWIFRQDLMNSSCACMVEFMKKYLSLFVNHFEQCVLDRLLYNSSIQMTNGCKVEVLQYGSDLELTPSMQLNEWPENYWLGAGAGDQASVCKVGIKDFEKTRPPLVKMLVVCTCCCCCSIDLVQLDYQVQAAEMAPASLDSQSHGKLRVQEQLSILR